MIKLKLPEEPISAPFTIAYRLISKYVAPWDFFKKLRRPIHIFRLINEVFK